MGLRSSNNAMSLRNISQGIQRHKVALLLITLSCWYFALTIPYLGDFPPLEWAQAGIMAPAHKLAESDVYGNDLFAGFHKTETLNYEYMPLYPLVVALSFKVFGTGVFQARLVSVVLGLITLLLTFRLGQQLYDSSIGVIAAAMLCLLRLGNDQIPEDIVYASGIPLADIARVIRYDIAVPVFVLAACICFCTAEMRRSRLLFLLTGGLVGLGILSHVYAAFILVVFCVILILRHKGKFVRRPYVYLIGLGCALTLLPWLAYVAQDLEAYSGQMLRHESRFELLNLGFYWSNLRREPFRYARWIVDSAGALHLFPRVGIWLLVLGVFIANVALVRRMREQRLSDQFALIALPVLALLLAALVDLKRYPYVVLVLPFLALQFGIGYSTLWAWASRQSIVLRGLIGVFAAAAVIEGVLGMNTSLQHAHATTPYVYVSQQLQRAVPAGSKVLLSQPYWLALADRDSRSINLVFVMSDPHYRIKPQLTMEQLIRQFAPNYIVVEDGFLNLPADSSTPKARAQWHRLAAYINNNCPKVVATIQTPEYGTTRAYECNGK
jgi:4-amino-4-deoxy-L-arabinose transferase-like glycosyltransferase